MKWLLLDMNYLCNRAFFAIRGIESDGVAVNVLFGIFRDILLWQERFETKHIVFAFDARGSKRKMIYPDYKGDRKHHWEQLTEEEREARQEMFRQIQALQDGILHDIGFRNLVSANGFEADDCIASVVTEPVKRKRNHVIISSDSDYYQLLSPHCHVFDPNSKRLITQKDFEKEWELSPGLWADVKSIAGGKDNLPGVVGVGKKTAAKFLRGKLKPDSALYRRIIFNNDVWENNLPLARLPFDKTPTFRLRPDSVTAEKWRKVLIGLDMETLIAQLPGAIKRPRKTRR